MNKRGLSTIVVTIILVALVLVAVGIVWAVISGLIGKGSATIEVQGKCVNVDVKAMSVDCTDPAACLVTLEKTRGSEILGGVKVVFKNATGGVNSGVLDVADDVPALVGKTATLDSGVDTPNRIETTTYFLDESGVEVLCTQTTYLNF